MSEAMRPYRLMALNNAWANATLYRAVSAMSQPEFTAPRPGFFPSLAGTLNHILAVDLYYIDALEEGGAGRRVFEREDILDPKALGAAQAEADMRLAVFCHAIGAGELGASRSTDRAGGPVTETIEALLLHLFQHQIHHRGQAHVQLQEAGIAPPQLDEFHLSFERAPDAKAYFR